MRHKYPASLAPSAGPWSDSNSGSTTSSRLRVRTNRPGAFAAAYVGVFALFFVLHAGVFRTYRDSILVLSDLDRRRRLQKTPSSEAAGARLPTSSLSASHSASAADPAKGSHPSTEHEGTAAPTASSEVDGARCLARRSRQYAAANGTSPLSPSSLGEPTVSLENQRRLAAGGYLQIAKGSGDAAAAGPLLVELSRLQHSSGIAGAVGELGVHHGRFASFLFSTARRHEPLVVADLFLEHQDENVDLSGLGDYRQFVKGLRVYGLTESDLHTVYRGNTAGLPLDWSSQSNFGPFRLVSVDAGHTATATAKDLNLVFCNLLEGGIVVLDDWFHPNWPGVVEGYYRFAHQPLQQATGVDADTPNTPKKGVRPPAAAAVATALEAYPFLVCESKLYLTNTLEHHDRYYRLLRDDPAFRGLLSPYSLEKKRGNVLYEMHDGVNYLRCPSRQEMSESDLRELWSSRAY